MQTEVETLGRPYSERTVSTGCQAKIDRLSGHDLPQAYQFGETADKEIFHEF